MSNKFTEEQYQEIIRTYDNNYGSEYKVMAVIRVVDDFNFDNNLSYNEAVAIANPLTREWAHEQFVEKEKKYVWRDKYTGYVIYKMLNDWSLSATALGEKHFTETELENSPFKPEWFDKEEVD